MEKWKSGIGLTCKGYEKKWKMEKLLCVCRQFFFIYPLGKILRLLFLIDFSNKFFID
jgi:hypothetical protein